MVSREVPLSLLSGIGFKLTDKEKRRWMMSKRAEECIPKEMISRGLRDGKIKSEETGAGGTVYTFTFAPSEAPKQKHVYTMFYSGGEVYVEIDPTHIEESKLPSEAGKSMEDIGEARLNKFFLGLKGCQKSYTFMKQPKAPFAEPAPAMPAGPAAAGAPPPGWGGEPAARAPAPDYGNLDEMIAKMKLGGRRRKTNRKSMRHKGKKSLRRK